MGAISQEAGVQEWMQQDHAAINREVRLEESKEEVNLSTLSDLTGFPVDFIKKELMLDGDASNEMALQELRSKMLNYLDRTMME